VRPVPRVGTTGRPAALLVVLAVAAWCWAPAAAQAHGLEVPPQLPVPQWMFGWGAVLALGASFVALGAAWRRPALERLARGRPVAIPRPLDLAVRAALHVIGLLLFALTLWAGFSGSPFPDENLAPVMVFVGFWVLVPVLSLVVGDVWRVLSPWRTIALLGAAVAARRGGPVPARRGSSAYGRRLAAATAVLSLVGFGWLELAEPDRADPVLLATLATAYCVLMLVGAAVFGRRFLDRADGFGRLFSLLAALAPLAWRGSTVRVRPPGVGVAEVEPGRTVAALVVVSVGIATFDGLSATALWAREDALGGRIEDVATSLGASPQWATSAAATVGLAASIGLVALIAHLGTGRLREHGPAGRRPGSGLGAFAPTLVPIAAAYLIAHYVQLLLVQGQSLVVLLSDPRGDGADLFGTASWSVDLQPLGTEAVWYVQVGALVLGHLAALAAAHDLALRTFPDRRAATRSQVPMLAAMVVLTALGLRLVSGSTLR